VRSSFAKSFGQDETDAQLLHCSIAKDKTKISLTIEQSNNRTMGWAIFALADRPSLGKMLLPWP
jgi:hypothetical protein